MDSTNIPMDMDTLYKRGTEMSSDQFRLEEGSYTFSVGGDEKGTQCLGVYLSHPVPGGYKYGDLALQVGGVSNLRR
jgi:hypothetical protein